MATACAGIAAAGPAFAEGARDAVLQTTLRGAPLDAQGTGFDAQVTVDETVTLKDFGDQVTSAFGPLVRDGFAREPVLALHAEKVVIENHQITGTLPLVYREEACAHVRIVSGRCTVDSDPLGVLITTQTASSRGWKVGTSIAINGKFPATVHVRGVYEPLDPHGTYWFDSLHRYFGQVAAFASSKTPRGDATLAPAAFWTRELPPVVGDDADASIDVVFVLDHIHASSLDEFRTRLNDALIGVQQPLGQDQRQANFTTGLIDLLDKYREAERSVEFPVLVVALQLVILAWLVLHLVLVSSAESRTGEVVLGKLRGLTPRETLAHALLEPLILVAVAVPLGVVVADAILTAAAPSVFGRHAEASLPANAWWAALLAGAGGLLALGAAGVSALRRTVVDQWRRAERRPRRRAWALDAIVITLAVAGFVDLAAAPSAQNAADTSGQFVAAAAPALLAVALALLAARVVPWLARTSFRRTRGSARVGLFVTVRQIGRRRGDLRVFLLLSVSVALLVFGLASRSVFADNRHDRALTDVGADRVLTVRPDAQHDLDAIVARLDPTGRAAAAVYQGPVDVIVPLGIDPNDGPSSTASMLVADPSRFAPVAFWRSDFASGSSLADRLTGLRRAPQQPVRITATRISVTVSEVVRSHLPVEFLIALTDHTGAPVVARLALLAPGSKSITSTFTASVPRCASGCLVRRFALRQNAEADTGTLAATVTIRRVVAGTTDVLPALLTTTWQTTDGQVGGRPVVEVDTNGGVLTVNFRPTFPADNPSQGYGLLSAVALTTPAAVTTSLINPAVQTVTATLDADHAIALDPTGVTLLPRAGDAGVLLPRSWLQVSLPDGYAQYAPNQVWLTPRAPKDFSARLTAAGVDVLTTETAAGQERALAEQGPSFAVAMLVFGALAAGGLAVAGAATSLLIASRRRLYEMAAMRSLGMSGGRVLRALILEQGVIALVAAFVGGVAGTVGARVALAKLPEFADRPPFPPLLIDLPWLLCVALAAAVVVAIVGVTAAGGASLVRRASPSRLREAQT